MHIIQKNIIEIELPASEDAFIWQETLVRLCEEKMEKILEDLLDELDSPNATISIDQIHIELENISTKNFEKQFLEAFKTAIRIELIEKINVEKQFFSVLPNEFLLSQKSEFQLFIYFLKNGTFPWWAKADSIAEIENKIIQYLSYESKENLRRILAETFKNENVRRRFVFQFTENFQSNFLHFFDIKYEQIIGFFEAVFMEVSKLLYQENYSKKEVNKLIKIELLNNIIEGKVLNISILFENIFYQLNSKSSLINQKTAVEIEDFIQKITFVFQEKKQTYSINSENIDFEVFKDNIFAKNTEKKVTSINKSSKENQAETIEGIYINNAGLVLLAPFLSEYLKACEAVQKEELIDKDLAIHAIQYLITGKQETPENELVLNKILCGIPIETEIVLAVELSEEIKAEAKKMLEAVIFYWDILQDTSIEGLRNSFLKRKGKISTKSDGDWLLQVEQEGYDMLLGHLPWTYSIIKLPTMNKTLWVEWA
jgi:Contractile injection system tape measure protein